MTFAELPINARFAFADSPRGDVKIKTGFSRWKWEGYVGYLPVANGCRAGREVVEIKAGDMADRPKPLDTRNLPPGTVILADRPFIGECPCEVIEVHLGNDPSADLVRLRGPGGEVFVSRRDWCRAMDDEIDERP